MGFREDVKKIKALTDENRLAISMGRSADVICWRN